jgi:hypothetical protein
MTPHQFITLGVRLFAVWLVVVSFQMIGIAFGMAAPGGGAAARPLWLQLLPFLPIGLAALLWSCPALVARKLIPLTRETEVVRLPLRQAAAAATAVLGLWAIIISLPNIIGDLYLISQYSGPYMERERGAHLVAVIAQSAIGVVLLFKPWLVADRMFPLATNADTST